jgi:hypothetical protein
MANSGTVKAVPKIRKHNIHNPASLSVNSKRGGEEVALLTGIPEMSLVRISAGSMAISWVSCGFASYIIHVSVVELSHLGQEP